MGSEDTLGTLILDFKNAWHVILYMFVITLVITIIYVYLLKFIAKPLLYTSLVLIVLGLVGGGGFVFYLSQGVVEEDPETQKQIQAAYYAGAGVIWIVSLIVIIFLCCNWRNIRLGASILQASSDFLAKNTRIIFLPLLNYMVMIPIFGAWLFFMAHLASIGTPVYVENSYIATM